ncbi:MAG: hypothetical protein ACLFQR_00335 [Desulfovibrionales bacterium]
MSIILYQAVGVGNEIERIIQSIGWKDDLEVHQSSKELQARLLCELHSVSLVILRITTREELDEIYEYRDLLDGLRIIVAADGSACETMTRIHALFPRYVSLNSPDFHDIRQVLEKLYNRAAGNGLKHKE